ncbi:MAG: pilus assembly protein PilP, partial [Acidobacteria bacterium]|nr:pilus assembly protein PilP [Acidobacteriota bacterium]
INEIVIQGLIKSEKRGYEALVLGSDNKIYWIKPGDELFDGRVLSIGVSVDKKTGKQIEKVVFRQEIDDPSQLLPYRDITKYLNK